MIKMIDLIKERGRESKQNILHNTEKWKVCVKERESIQAWKEKLNN